MAHNPWQRWKRGQARDGVVTRPPQRALDRHRLRHLLDAIGAVSTGIDTRTVLRRIVEAATDLVDARYGALLPHRNRGSRSMRSLSHRSRETSALG